MGVVEAVVLAMGGIEVLWKTTDEVWSAGMTAGYEC